MSLPMIRTVYLGMYRIREDNSLQKVVMSISSLALVGQ